MNFNKNFAVKAAGTGLFGALFISRIIGVDSSNNLQKRLIYNEAVSELKDCNKVLDSTNVDTCIMLNENYANKTLVADSSGSIVVRYAFASKLDFNEAVRAQAYVNSEGAPYIDPKNDLLTLGAGTGAFILSILALTELSLPSTRRPSNDDSLLLSSSAVDKTADL